MAVTSADDSAIPLATETVEVFSAQIIDSQYKDSFSLLIREYTAFLGLDEVNINFDR